MSFNTKSLEKTFPALLSSSIIPNQEDIRSAANDFKKTFQDFTSFTEINNELYISPGAVWTPPETIGDPETRVLSILQPVTVKDFADKHRGFKITCRPSSADFADRRFEVLALAGIIRLFGEDLKIQFKDRPILITTQSAHFTHYATLNELVPLRAGYAFAAECILPFEKAFPFIQKTDINRRALRPSEKEELRSLMVGTTPHYPSHSEKALQTILWIHSFMGMEDYLTHKPGPSL